MRAASSSQIFEREKAGLGGDSTKADRRKLTLVKATANCCVLVEQQCGTISDFADVSFWAWSPARSRIVAERRNYEVRNPYSAGRQGRTTKSGIGQRSMRSSARRRDARLLGPPAGTVAECPARGCRCPCRCGGYRASKLMHMPTIAVRMPNGALTSLAGNLDPHHRVAAADLLLVQNRVRETVDRLVEGMRFEPPVPPKRETPTRLPFSSLRHLPFPPAFYAGCVAAWRASTRFHRFRRGKGVMMPAGGNASGCELCWPLKGCAGAPIDRQRAA